MVALCSDRDVRLSVRPSVTLMDCYQMMQQKVEMGTRQDRGYLHAKADLDRSIL